MLSLKHNCIFIHIPKTAGTAIENALRGTVENPVEGGSTHNPLGWYAMNHPEVFEGMTKFTVVRNPYNRLRSMWAYHYHGGNNMGDEKLGVEKDFHWFVKRYLADGEAFPVKDFLRPQTDYITVPLRDDATDKEREAFDVVLLEYERLGTDWPVFAKMVGVSDELPRVRVTPPAPDYEWTQETLNIVNEYYKEDFEHLPYVMSKRP